jgi:hypothetical protein
LSLRAGTRHSAARLAAVSDLPEGTDTLPQIENIIILMMENPF